MPDNKLTRSEIAIGMMGLFPKIIRASALEDRDFRLRLGLSVDAIIRLDQSGQRFGRAKLFSAIRKLYQDTSADIDIASEDGVVWKLRLKENDEAICLVGEITEVALPSFLCLSPDRAKRLEWFDREAVKFELTDARSQRWREILGAREVDDEEVDELLSEIRLTPRYVASSIANHLRGENLSIFSLVPSDVRYYDRLVGEPHENTNLKSFVDSCAASNLRNWMKSPIDGLKHSLLLSSHLWFPAAIPMTEVPREEVLNVYNWLEVRGDRISQLGALESGLASLDKFPELEPILGRIAAHFVNDGPDDEEGRLTLLCSLIVMVEGEIARTGIARNRAPFWRRLAAIAHASVMEREMIAAGIPASTIHDWAFPSRGQQYYLQNFIDLRREPRWLPDFILPSQLKAEFIGRIFTAAHLHLEKVQSPELKAYLSADETAPVKSLVKFPFAFLPGPLEGGIDSIVEMPADVESDLRIALEAEELTGQSFVSLVNSPLIFKIGPQLAQLAAQALRRAKYQLRKMKAQNDAFSLLSGLAVVAAVTRSAELADEVRILVRVFRRRPGIDIAPEDAMRIAMIAAASHVDKAKWCTFVGDWLTELAFEDMPREKAAFLHQHVRVFCQLEPNLWETCARAEAALSSYIKSSAA